MARKYDIAQRIANANQKPTAIIDEDHEYKINNSKSVAIMLQALSDESKDKGAEFLDEVITLTLGKEAHEYIESMDLTMPAYESIVMAVMAAMQDVSIEEAEEEAKKGKK